VVDNAPSDESTRSVVAEFPRARYVAEPRPGLNFARNRAACEARGELLAYVDDDVVVDRHWCRGLREAWSTHPDAAAFTGQVLPLELETKAQIIFEERGGFRRGFERVRYTESIPAGDDGFLYPCRSGIFGVGCNMAFHRASLIEIGSFDEALDTGPPLPGGGDHDILYRVIRAGHPLVYDPGILVFHQHRRTSRELRRQYWTWGRSIMAVASKARRSDPPMRLRWIRLELAWFTSRTKELIGALFRRHRIPARFVLWEMIGGLSGLCGEYRRSRRRIEEIRRRFS
jgi:GT2 family glycosyltransferase